MSGKIFAGGKTPERSAVSTRLCAIVEADDEENRQAGLHRDHKLDAAGPVGSRNNRPGAIERDCKVGSRLTRQALILRLEFGTAPTDE